MAQGNRMVGGVYHPRAKGGAMSDALADAKHALARLTRMALMRGAGALLFVAALAALAALASYHGDDASFNNANARPVANLLGPLGATAADLLLQTFGFAAMFAFAPLLVWGIRALRGKSLRYAMWRLLAWPLGTLIVAAGLGILPAPASFPAGAGGWIGIATAGLSVHAAQTFGAPSLSYVLPLFLLAVGLPLAFLATGLRFIPLVRSIWNFPTNAAGIFDRMRLANLRKPQAVVEDEETDYEYEEDNDGEGYHLDVVPESLAATKLAERREGRESRVKREEARKAPPAANRKQGALNLGAGEYQLPALELLAEPVAVKDSQKLTDEALEENARMLEAVLADFGVKGRITAVRPGPVVTLYEFEPAAGVKSSRVVSLSDDVARSMSAVATRIAVISGRNVIGIELPNQVRETVFLREMIACSDYEKARAPLTLALGKTIGGEPVMADLAKMPHLLVAGTTGSGKSVGLNTMILSLLYRMAPEQCRSQAAHRRQSCH